MAVIARDEKLHELIESDSEVEQLCTGFGSF
jgi:hypothetical protein